MALHPTEQDIASARAAALLGTMFGLYPQLREDILKSIESNDVWQSRTKKKAKRKAKASKRKRDR